MEGVFAEDGAGWTCQTRMHESEGIGDVVIESGETPTRAKVIAMVAFAGPWPVDGLRRFHGTGGGGSSPRMMEGD